jgi:hypothetical protein
VNRSGIGSHTNSPESGASRIVLVVSVAFVIAVLWWARLRQWYPHDEGALAQAAARVLQGQMPHRDFSYPYSGLDAPLHALFLVILGPSLAAIRTGFAVVGSLWLLGMAAWFRGHLGSSGASVVVLVLGAWSFAVYPAAVPSWYVTMLVTTAIAVMVPPGFPGAAGSPLVAGVLLGVALGFKVTALYAIAGLAIWLLIRRDERMPAGGRVVVLGLFLVLAMAIVLLLASNTTGRTLVHLALPPLAIVAWAMMEELRAARGRGWRAGVESVRPLLRLAVGAGLGVAPLVLWLLSGGALGRFLVSVAHAGQLRTTFAGMPPPPLTSLLYALPLIALVLASLGPRPPRTALIALSGAMVLGLAWADFRWHRALWQAMRGAVPIGVLLLLVWLYVRRLAPGTWLAPVLVFGLMTLSQFPFAAPAYFVYVIPILLMGASGARELAPRSRAAVATLAILFALFSYTQVIPAPAAARGWSRGRSVPLARLPGIHGGLLVARDDSVAYDRLLTILRDSVPTGPIWSGPDSPEVGFLAGRQDLNTAFFGFLDEQREERPPLGLDAAALVIRRAPAFSAAPTAAQLAEWSRAYAHQADAGAYLVLWGRVP